MKYIENTCVDPFYNLAFEEYVFNNLSKEDEYLILWQNDNTIVVGKYQNTIKEINNQYVDDNNINVVRRLSGGGAVYHDLGNLNFTFIVNQNNKNIDFSQFYRPIIEALQSFNVNAYANGRNDIVIDGKKFSGNAQYIKNGRVMHHGTIMYNSNLSVLSDALSVSKDKIEGKGITSVRSRVTNVIDYMPCPISINEFKTRLAESISHTKTGNITLTNKDLECIEKLKSEKYNTWDWNYGNSPKYNILKERRLADFGKIEIYMEIHDGIINGSKIYGDFFGNKDINDIIDLLNGCKLNESDIMEKFSNIDITTYLSNMDLKSFAEIIVK